jgi:hypothetical protein
MTHLYFHPIQSHCNPWSWKSASNNIRIFQLITHAYLLTNLNFTVATYSQTNNWTQSLTGSNVNAFHPPLIRKK